MLEPRGYGAAASLRSSVLFMGGGNGSTWMNSVLRYDLNKGSWEQVPTLCVTVVGHPSCSCCHACASAVENLRHGYDMSCAACATQQLMQHVVASRALFHAGA